MDIFCPPHNTNKYTRKMKNDELTPTKQAPSNLPSLRGTWEEWQTEACDDSPMPPDGYKLSFQGDRATWTKPDGEKITGRGLEIIFPDPEPKFAFIIMDENDLIILALSGTFVANNPSEMVTFMTNDHRDCMAKKREHWFKKS